MSVFLGLIATVVPVYLTGGLSSTVDYDGSNISK
jgi:hypothetical protein